MTFDNTLTDLLSRGVAVRFQARGESMKPAIRSGDHVYVRPMLDRRSPRVGDVVLVRAPRGLTAHRVVKITPNGIVTRGDNSLLSDFALGHDAIVGHLTHVERDGNMVPLPLRAPRFFARLRLAFAFLFHAW